MFFSFTNIYLEMFGACLHHWPFCLPVTSDSTHSPRCLQFPPGSKSCICPPLWGTSIKKLKLSQTRQALESNVTIFFLGRNDYLIKRHLSLISIFWLLWLKHIAVMWRWKSLTYIYFFRVCSYVQSACKIFKAAEECRLDRDEEKAYVLYMKYLTVYDIIKKRPEFKQQPVYLIFISLFILFVLLT